MRISNPVIVLLAVAWVVHPAGAQEGSVQTIITEIGLLEGERDPKCYATANRLEDFMYGTPLSFDARVEKIALQKELVSAAWRQASADADARGGSQVETTDLEPLVKQALKASKTPSGDMVVTTPAGEQITLRADDLRQYGSVAYGLRTVLTVQQDALLKPGPPLLPLAPESVRMLKELLDLHTLAALQLADRAARLADQREVSASMLVAAWRSLRSVARDGSGVTPTPSAAPPGDPSAFVTARALIDQKVASYQAYNEISLPVFVRNLQVYFARHRWPSADEEVAFKEYFNQAMVFFATDLILGAEKAARERSQAIVRVEHVHSFLLVFLPHEVNEYEDVVFLPRFPAAERITVESYDLDAFRDSGLHWMYLKWAIEDPAFAGTLEPDPFALELAAEGVAQFAVLSLRVAGEVAREEVSDRLAVRHLESGLRRIQEMLDRHAGLEAMGAVPASRVASAAESGNPAEVTYFTDVTERSGVDFEHRTADWLSRLLRSYTVREGEVAQLAIPPAFGGGGVAAEDIDNDGYPDVLLLGGAGNRLFLNDSGGGFRDVTDEAGIDWRRGDGHPGEPRQPVIADFDNDGLQDILITYAGDAHRLYRNLGALRFADVTDRAGLGGEGDVGGPATAFDFDGDGLLDLYIGSFGDYPHGVLPTLARRNNNGLPNHLFRNLGGMRFGDVTPGSGVANTGWTQAVGHADFDRDGREDLIVGNDFGVNSYYRNLGDGRFEEMSAALGTGKPSYTMNIGITDLNRDGHPDFYISNIVTMDKDEKYVLPDAKTRMKFDPETMAHLRVVEANDLFTSQVEDGALTGYVLSEAVGRGRSSTGWSWDADFFDFDNDGDDDLYCVNGMNEYALYSSQNPYYTDPSGADRPVIIPVAERESNVFFVNRDGRLDNDSERSGADLLGNSRSVAYLDYDLDGDLDMVVNNFQDSVVLYRNNAEERGNHWLGIRLVGDPGSGSTRDAVGAVIEVETEHHEGLWRAVSSTIGYLSVHPKTQHFGLGNDTRADVVVHWPGGEVSRFEDLAADAVHIIVQGRGLREGHEGSTGSSASVGVSGRD
jgi:hypothetical protein